ncbi:hypothetical protein KI387_040889, partial [Taxus chinensis]
KSDWSLIHRRPLCPHPLLHLKRNNNSTTTFAAIQIVLMLIQVNSTRLEELGMRMCWTVKEGRWEIDSPDKTLALLKIRSEMDANFRDASLKRTPLGRRS